FLMTREELENKMAVLLGGRAAELVVYGHLSTGAADDLRRVTDIARSMVTRYGMSEQLGSVAYERDNQSFLAPGTSRSADYGEAAGDAIDAEVRAIVTSALERTRKLLQDKRDVLERAVPELWPARDRARGGKCALRHGRDAHLLQLGRSRRRRRRAARCRRRQFCPSRRRLWPQDR
ncbi:MAG: hypothetical protein E6614_36135, partial [Bradyrhizobium sp.]|nr:hypothetical protein [Bradyrhizobium sp.]